MKKNKILQIFYFLIFFTQFFAYSAEFQVESQNGIKMVVSNVQFGTFSVTETGTRIQVGQDLSGNPVFKYKDRRSELIPATQVEARVGSAFGYEFQLPYIPANEIVKIEMVVKLPTVSVRRDLKSDTIISSFIFTSSDSEKVKRVWWEFRKENPKYHITGEWIISLFQSGRLLISQSFQVKQ